jgi:hypothetical protein
MMISKTVTAGGNMTPEREEEEDGPEFRDLFWKKDGITIGNALIDDDVTLFCEVKNIDDGEMVKFKIFEQGENKDDPIDEVEGEVKDGEVQAAWKVEYKEEENSNTTEEIEEQGWTIPDYYFVAEYNGVESGQSKILDMKGWVKIIARNKETGEIQTNKKYTLYLPDGSTRKGVTDDEGAIYQRKLPVGESQLIVSEEEGQ